MSQFHSLWPWRLPWSREKVMERQQDETRRQRCARHRDDMQRADALLTAAFDDVQRALRDGFKESPARLDAN